MLDILRTRRFSRGFANDVKPMSHLALNKERRMRRRWTVALAVIWAAMFCGPGDQTVRGDLVSEWRFNETGGSVAFDNVGGINGTLLGGAMFDPGAGPGTGVYSGAISLSSATDSFVNMGKVYPFTSGDFSIIVWINTNQTSAPPVTPQGQGVLSEHHTGSGNGYFIALNNVGDGHGTTGSHFYASDSAVGSTQNVNDGVWHQLAIVYQSGGASMSYYIDGTLAGSAGGHAIVANDAPFLVGGVDFLGTPTGTYNGLISDVRVYDTALSSQDVESVYQAVVAPAPEPSTFVMALIASPALLVFMVSRLRRARS
jgi:hypothetical protein